MSLVADKQKLPAAVRIIASCLQDLPRTDYLICAITRSDDLEDSACALYSNLCWHDFDENGRLKPPTIGMMVDVDHRGPCERPVGKDGTGKLARPRASQGPTFQG